MRLGFNMLLWSPFVTEAIFPRFAQLKAAGYDGVELPFFDGTPEHYRHVRRCGMPACAARALSSSRMKAATA
jgi:D-psicose/D-tagatose/L-ribulose 3-epimerase